MKEGLKRGQRPADWKNHCPKFKEYYSTQNPEWSEEECIKAAKKYCREINWQCIEFYQKKYPDKTLEECENLRKEAVFNKRCNSQQYIEYYEKRFPDATPEERIEMLNNAKKNYLSKRPNNSGGNNPAHKSKTSELERRQRSPKCIEFYELRYPNLTEKEYIDMVNEHKKLTNSRLTPDKYSTKIEYWTTKGYSVEEAQKKLDEKNKERSFTLEKCIRKYGVEEGTRKFNKRQEKWLKSLYKNFEKYGDGRSCGSEFAYDVISCICDRLYINKPIKEKFMTDEDGSCYSYDFKLNKKLIEFNEDYWHMNPSIYKENDINNTTKKTAKEIWDYDYKKKLCAERHGYKLLYIWESEYKESRDKVIKKCIKFLTT